MSVTVGVNNLSVIHKGSGGITLCFPDICKTPIGPAVVPIPYPNTALSSHTAKAAKKVKCDGKPVSVKTSTFNTSTGDEPGVAKGIISNKTKGKAEYVSYSFDTKIEGKNVPRAYDLMLHNNKNTPPFPVIQKPIVHIPTNEDVTCLICNKKL